MRRSSFERSAVIGAAFMAALGVVAGWRWHQTGYVFFALVLLRDVLGALLLLTRKPVENRGGLASSLLAYCSCVLPLIYLPATAVLSRAAALGASLLAITGYLVATLALIELGTAFGVAPAKRGARRRSGVYRYIRHPMYVGYVIAETGLVLLNPINVAIFVVSTSAYCVRAWFEERVLSSGNTRGLE